MKFCFVLFLRKKRVVGDGIFWWHCTQKRSNWKHKTYYWWLQYLESTANSVLFWKCKRRLRRAGGVARGSMHKALGLIPGTMKKIKRLRTHQGSQLLKTLWFPTLGPFATSPMLTAFLVTTACDCTLVHQGERTHSVFFSFFNSNLQLGIQLLQASFSLILPTQPTCQDSCCKNQRKIFYEVRNGIQCTL